MINVSIISFVYNLMLLILTFDQHIPYFDTNTFRFVFRLCYAIIWEPSACCCSTWKTLDQSQELFEYISIVTYNLMCLKCVRMYTLWKSVATLNPWKEITIIVRSCGAAWFLKRLVEDPVELLDSWKDLLCFYNTEITLIRLKLFLLSNFQFSSHFNKSIFYWFFFDRFLQVLPISFVICHSHS